jgi:Histidine kinase-, DNA gyrase B-, and HSP90-like ATPase
MPAEKVRLRIGNLAKAVLVTGQAYQDPKDALNEFISNAADEYAESDRRGERIRVVLRRKGSRPLIAIEDNGRGLSKDRLRDLARNLFESSKVGDARTLGEKAIGLLAFQQLGGRCDIVSRTVDSDETWVLRLTRGSATASLDLERRKPRTTPGTTVFLSDLDPDVLRVLTTRKVVEYLRTRRGAAIAAGAYEIEVIEGRSGELVTPDRPDGIRLDLPARPTLWGRIEFNLFVAPNDGSRRRVAAVGRAGTTIIDDISELDEFNGEPWASDQVAGQIIFEGLQQSAGRRAILRDRDAFPVFVDAIQTVQPIVSLAITRVSREVDASTADRVADTLRKVFDKVLRELSDFDNPMRTPTGTDEGEGGLFARQQRPLKPPLPPPNPSGNDGDDDAPDAPELERDRPLQPPAPAARSARPDGRRTTSLPSVAPDPNPGAARSRFEVNDGVVLYSERHNDYLVVKDDEPALLDYLATLIAKEYVVFNNPRATAGDLGEEMVRMLVRLRRHLPRRR